MSAIPGPIQSLLDLFSSDLNDVRFGDVDATTLAGIAADVETAAGAVASAQAVVDEARAKLQERQDLLMQQAQRALAYARVYAEANAELTARLDAIALPRPVRRVRPEADVLVLTSEAQPARRPRGRPRKTPLAEPAVAEPEIPTLEATGE
jgi:hypothetical protein